MFTDWKPAKSDGTLQMHGPASQFQYRRYINWITPLLTLGISYKEATGGWKIQLIDPDNAVLFEQKITIRLSVVALGFIGAQFFTWRFVKETIETTIIGRQPVTEDNPAWSHTLGGTIFSETGLMEAAGGISYTDVEAIITDWYDSPIYNMTVPEGTKMKVLHDEWGLGVSTRPEFQFRFKKGFLQQIDCKFGPFGELVVAKAHERSSLIETGHTWGDHKDFTPSGFIGTATDPCIVIMPDGRRIMGVLQSDGYWLYESLDMERSWKKFTYLSGEPNDTEKEAVALFGAGVIMPQVARIGNILLVMCIKGSRVQVRRIVEDVISELIDVAPVVGTDTYAIDVDDSGIAHIVNSSGNSIWKSHEQGTGWKEYVTNAGTQT